MRKRPRRDTMTFTAPIVPLWILYTVYIFLYIRLNVGLFFSFSVYRYVASVYFYYFKSTFTYFRPSVFIFCSVPGSLRILVLRLIRAIFRLRQSEEIRVEFVSF